MCTWRSKKPPNSAATLRCDAYARRSDKSQRNKKSTHLFTRSATVCRDPQKSDEGEMHVQHTPHTTLISTSSLDQHHLTSRTDTFALILNRSRSVTKVSSRLCVAKYVTLRTSCFTIQNRCLELDFAGTPSRVSNELFFCQKPKNWLFEGDARHLRIFNGACC